MKNYSNERSIYLAQLRDSIEAPWQAWELSQIDVDALKALSTDEVCTTNAFGVATSECAVTQMEVCLVRRLSVAWFCSHAMHVWRESHAMHVWREPWLMYHALLYM